MLVSVVICTCNIDNYQNLVEAVDSLSMQTHRETEVVIVVDSSDELLCQKVVAHYSDRNNIKVALTGQGLGAFGAGNMGVQMARGEIIAFTDDDAVAERNWLENLVYTYEKSDAISVGGKILPMWICSKPDYLPEEMYWLIGATQQGFAEEEDTYVRNTFGPNMSFRKEVFERVGLFDKRLGFVQRPASYMQGGEAELALRMKQKLGKGVIYNPKAIVYHRVSSSKIKVRTLLKRAFYQGYSKAQLKRLSGSTEALTVEKSYLNRLLVRNIPSRVKRIFWGLKRTREITQLSFLVVLTLSVGIGFLYGYVKRVQKSC
ncbi:glycosyltransferase family 2 protein [Chloroflexota bacterium]